MPERPRKPPDNRIVGAAFVARAPTRRVRCLAISIRAMSIRATETTVFTIAKTSG